MDKTKFPLIALIPAYQAESTIESVVKQTLSFASEVWVGDDGSTDQTAFLAKEAGAKVVRLEKNHGKGEMLRILFQQIKTLPYSAVITLDADGQHDPQVISKFWQTHRQFPNALLLGNRSEGSIPWLRKSANFLASRALSYLSGSDIRDSQCGMRLIPYEILHQVTTVTPRFVMETEFLWETIKAGYEIRSIALAAHYPEDWKTHFQSWRDAWAIAHYLVRQLT